MKTRKILTLGAAVAAALTLGSCSEKKFNVEGTLSEAADSMLYLENVGLEGITAIDSVKLGEDGTFSLSGEQTPAPEFYRLRIHDQIINLCVDSTETITIKAAYPTMAGKYEVTGSDNCEKIRELTLKQMELQERCFKVNRELPGVNGRDSLRNMIEAYKQDVTRNYIYAAPNKPYAYFALFQTVAGMLIFDPQTNHQDIKAFAAVATSWDQNYPDAMRTKNLHNIAINGMRNDRIAQNNTLTEAVTQQLDAAGIIDITLIDNKGQQRSLSDLKGKVVLLDFHVFGMEESPKRILAMRELYTKFSGQGFEIYQVALDGDEHFWKQQTAALPWVSVRDPRGLSSPLLVSYNVGTVPDYFLIDRNSNIVLRMAQASDIESEIQKRL